MSKDVVRLNLGCGIDIRKDYVNIDIQQFSGVDVVADVINLTDIKDSSVEFVLAQNILAYIPRTDMLKALQEWRRVLVDGGHLEIRTTDVGLLCRAMFHNSLSKEMGLHHEMVISLLYGRQKDKYDIRYNGFTSEVLQGILMGVGMKVVKVVSENYDVIVVARK